MADCSIPRYGAVTVTIFACSTVPSPYSASAPTTAPLACSTPLQRTADACFCTHIPSPVIIIHQARETPPLSFPLRDRPFSSILDRFFLRFYIHPSPILPFHPLFSLPPSPSRSIFSINQRPTSPHHVSSASANLKPTIIPISNSFSQLANTHSTLSLPSLLSFPSTVPSKVLPLLYSIPLRVLRSCPPLFVATNRPPSGPLFTTLVTSYQSTFTHCLSLLFFHGHVYLS